jgi:hypothetical protein
MNCLPPCLYSTILFLGSNGGRQVDFAKHSADRLDTIEVRTAIRRLLFGFTLILLASAMLLISDLHRRRSAGKIPRLAIVQHSASAVLDEGVLGVLDSLKANGLMTAKTSA